MIKILLADSQITSRNKIKSLLSNSNLIKIVVETPDIKQFIKKITTDEPIDLIISSWYSYTKIELEWLASVRKYKPGVPIVLLTMMTNDENIRNAFVSGASGYLLSNVESEELVFAIKHIIKGNTYLSSHLSLELINRIPAHSQDLKKMKNVYFSENELKLLQAISDGLSNKEIAEVFYLSKRSIESQRAILIKKAGVNNTATLIKYACINKLVK